MQTRLIPEMLIARCLGFLFALVCLEGAFNYAGIHIGTTFVTWTTNFSIIFICIYWGYKKNKIFNKSYLLCGLFLCWAFIGAIRGIPLLNNYWYTKQFLTGVMCVSLPCFVYVLSNPMIVIEILRRWNNLVIPLFIFFFSWKAIAGAHHFYLGPIYFLHGLFWFWLPKKWKIITLFCLCLMIVIDTGARSQVIKAIICITMAIVIRLHAYIPTFIIRFGSLFMYFIAIVLLYLGISGTYNIFDHKDHSAENSPVVFSEGVFLKDNGNPTESLIDTRSFIYMEVIESALINDYVIEGRTLARGNDSVSFGKDSMIEEDERYRNELCHLNIFTWLGLIGTILYSLIYLQASIVAAFFSKNIYVKYLGALVSFHWLYGWIEDMNQFDGMNIGLWMIIGICISPLFRKMSNAEFELWFRSIFCNRQIPPYILNIFLKYRIKQIIAKRFL